LYFVSSQQWWTRYWQLGRKIEMQGGHPTPYDVRRAAILAQFASQLGGNAGQSPAMTTAADNIQWVIDYGKADFEARLRAAKAEAGLGTER